jgi:hypothetical protein
MTRSTIVFLGCFAAACGSKSDGDDSTGLTSGSATATVSSTTTGAGSSSNTNSGTSGASATTSASGLGSTGGAQTTDSGSTGTGNSTGGGGPKFDLPEIPDFPQEECIECSLTIDSQQSGVFNISGGSVFATAELTNEIVYAIGNYGTGRFVATADSSLPFNEQTDCPLHEWLAGEALATATVLSFGWTPSDGPKNWAVPNETEEGVHLPAMYIGDPAALAADYDVVMYLEGSGQFDMGDEPTDAEMQTVLDYVSIHGGGLYVSSEFANGNGAYLNAADLVSVNRIMMPLGVEALEVSLNWGNVDGNIDFACFPAPEG